ncbi:MAG TPA: penicillin-binding protein 2 [Humibacter sp.]|nr:penicillin-binding protein 2 [Humibacter sp.]
MMSPVSSRRRAVVAILVIVAMVAVLIVRLVDLQVVRADALDRQSAEARGAVLKTVGTRGSIVAADGTVLASSVLRYDVIASPMNANTFDRTDAAGHDTKVTRAMAAAEIAAATDQTAADVLSTISAALKDNPESQYAVLAQSIDVPAYKKLRSAGIPWLSFPSHQTRVYPNGAVAGNVLGFVGADGNPQAGLESEYDKCLRGSDGEETFQTSEDGVTIPGSTVTRKKAKNGGTLVTTLDTDLNWFAQDELAKAVKKLHAEFGMVSVVSVKDGAIKAAAQYPTVDPNNVGATAPQYRGAMMFQNQYEPGSIFKPLTAAALIEAGKATPFTQVRVPDVLTPGGGVMVRDSEAHPTQNLTMTGVLTESSNVGMSLLGTRLSDTRRYDFLRKLGIGSSTHSGFPAEASGQLHPPSEWDAQTRYATTFGQAVSASQVQMLSAYQTIANGGVRVPLTLVDGCKNADGTITSAPSGKGTRIIAKKTSQEVLGMLENVLKGGPLSTLPDTEFPGYTIAAKTGTAQEPDGNGVYRSGSYYVSIMGIAPVDDPQYVVSVNIGFPTTITSSYAARPLFQQVMNQVLKTFRVKPSTTPQSNYPDTY